MINRCDMCKKEEEDIDHIFLHYDYSRSIWDMLCKKRKSNGSYWMMLNNVFYNGWIM